MTKDFDGAGKTIEYKLEENIYREILRVEQKVTYTYADGQERVYLAFGDHDAMEVFMPSAERIDVEYATDAILDLKYRDVTLCVISENGVLFVPEDAKQMVKDYLYKLAVKNDEVHVVLDWNTMDGLSRIKGDALLLVHEATPEDLTSAQRRTVGDRLAISITLQVDGEYVSQLGGHADISVKTDDQEMQVYYVDTDGRTTLLESDYRDGDTHVSVNHFSVYMYTKDDMSEGFPIWAIIIVTIAAGLIILLLMWKIKRD